MLRLLVVALIVAAIPPLIETNATWELLTDGSQTDGFEQGQLTPFGVLTLDQHGQLAQNSAGLRIDLDDVTLYEVPLTAPEPDGVQPIFVAFPRAGRLNVSAWLVGDEPVKGLEANVFESYGPDARPVVAVKGLDGGLASGPITIMPTLNDAQGKPLWHYDVLFEIFQGDMSILRAQTHNHEIPQELTFTPSLPGPYRVDMLFYNGLAVKNTTFGMVAANFSFTAIPAQPGEPVNTTVPTDFGEVDLVVASSHPEGASLGDYVSINAVAYKNSRRVAHVDFIGSITDPFGHVMMRSRTFHQSDSQLDFMFRPMVPGTYGIALTVVEPRKFSLTERTSIRVSATPDPAQPFIDVSGPTQATTGKGTVFDVRASGPSGEPLAGFPIELSAFRTGSTVPFIRHEFRLEDGQATPTISFLDAGDFEIRVASLGSPTVDGPVIVPVSVADSPNVVTESPTHDASTQPVASAPGVNPFLSLLVVVALAFLAWRR